jgi:hypothetical protein
VAVLKRKAASKVADLVSRGLVELGEREDFAEGGGEVFRLTAKLFVQHLYEA